MHEKEDLEFRNCLLMIRLSCITVIFFSFVVLLQLSPFIDLFPIFPNQIINENLFAKIPLNEIIQIIIGISSTILAIIFVISQISITYISEKYTPYILEKYQNHSNIKKMYSRFLFFIAMSVLFLLISGLITPIASLIIFSILLYSFTYIFSHLIKYYTYMFKLINPISYANLLKDEIITKIDNDSIHEKEIKIKSSVKNNETEVEIGELITSLCDICLKSLSRYEEKIALEYLWKLGDIIFNQIYVHKNLKFSSNIFDSYNRIIRHSIKNKDDIRHSVISEYLNTLNNVHFIFDEKGAMLDINVEFRYYFNKLFDANKCIIKNNDFELFKNELKYLSLNSFIQDPHDIIDDIIESINTIIFDDISRRDSWADTEYKCINIQKLLYISFSNYSNYIHLLKELKCLIDQEDKKPDTIKYLKTQLFSFYLSANVHKLFFVIGAYCIFIKKEKKIETEIYLRQLWTYTTPSDAEVFTLNQVPVSSDLEFLFNLLFFGGFKESIWYDDYSFDGYHGSKIYNYQYMILLLTYLLEYKKVDLNISISSYKSQEELDYIYTFSSKFIVEVDELIKCCEELIKEADNWKFLYPQKKVDTDTQMFQVIEEKTELTESKIQDYVEGTEEKLNNTIKWLETKKKYFNEKIIEVKSLESVQLLDEKKIEDCMAKTINYYEQESEIQNIVNIKTYNQFDEDKNLEFVQIGYRPLVQKDCFIKSANVDCSALWNSFSRTVTFGELNYFLSQINSNRQIDIIPVKNENSPLKALELVENLIKTLNEDGFKASTIFLPLDYLAETEKQNIEEGTDIYKKIRGRKYKSDDQTELDIIHSNKYVKFQDIIILDKNACDWTFKPNRENNSRLWIEIKEYEKDKSKIDLTIKTIINLTIRDHRGIKILRLKNGS